MMEDILKESGEARKLAVALSHVEYGGDLVDQLFTHSKHMERFMVAYNPLFRSPTHQTPNSLD